MQDYVSMMLVRQEGCRRLDYITGKLQKDDKRMKEERQRDERKVTDGYQKQGLRMIRTLQIDDRRNIMMNCMMT